MPLDPDVIAKADSVVFEQHAGKAAPSVARAIEREIIDGRYGVGMALGNEAELCERYGVSRWALREAIAIVQHDGLVQVRRGRGGGAIVNATPEQSLSAAICSFLLYTRGDTENLIAARLMIDRLLYDAATARLDAALVDSCSDLLTWNEANEDASSYAKRVLTKITELTGNAFLSVFAHALSKLTTCRLSLAGTDLETIIDPDISRSLALLRQSQLRAIVGIDANLSTIALSRWAETFRKMLDQINRASQSLVNLEPEDRFKRASRIAAVLHPDGDARAGGIVSVLIMLDIMDGGIEEGDQVGAESELVERYSVPRNVLREGIRILERDGLVRSQAGRLGGIRAGSPDVTGLVDRSERNFAFLKVSNSDIASLAVEMRMQAVDLLITRVQKALLRADDLADLSGRLQAHFDHRSIFLALAEGTQDQLIILFENIMLRFTHDSIVGKVDVSVLIDGLVDAVRAGRRESARFFAASLHKALFSLP